MYLNLVSAQRGRQPAGLAVVLVVGAAAAAGFGAAGAAVGVDGGVDFAPLLATTPTDTPAVAIEPFVLKAPLPNCH